MFAPSERTYCAIFRKHLVGGGSLLIHVRPPSLFVAVRTMSFRLSLVTSISPVGSSSGLQLNTYTIWFHHSDTGSSRIPGPSSKLGP